MSESQPSLRAPVRAEVRRGIESPCIAVLERGLRLMGQRALDLSPDGVLVETRIPVDQGARVTLTLRLPSGGWLHARGRVARVVSNRRPGDRGCAVAVQFTALGRTERERLRAALRGIPPTIPQRALRVAPTPPAIPVELRRAA